MSAYSSLGALPANLVLPLSGLQIVDVSLSTGISQAAASHISAATFTMPYRGMLSFVGHIRISTSGAGVQTADSGWSSSSTISVAGQPVSSYRTEGGAGFAVWNQPLTGRWADVAAGSVTLYFYVACGTGSPTITVNRVQGLLITSVI